MQNPNNIPVSQLDKGLVLNRPSIALEVGSLRACQNVVITDGHIESRTGFIKAFDGASGDLPSTFTPLAFYHNREFIVIDGTSSESDYFLAFGVVTSTNATAAYYWDGTNWTTMTGDGIGVALTTAYDHTVSISKGIEDTAAALGNPDFHALLVTYSPTKPSAVRSTSSTAPNQVFMVKDSAPTALSTTDAPAFATKKAISYFGHVVLLGVGDATYNDSLRIKWSTVNTTDGWDLSDFTSSGSGYTWIADTNGAILTGETLRNNIICYKEDSIAQGTKISSAPYVRWETVLPDVGLMGPRMLASFNNRHYFVGTDNIYSYGGGVDIQPIGDKIWTQFLADVRDGGAAADKLYRHRGFASLHPDIGTVAFWIVTGTNEWPTKAYVYSIFDDAWTIWNAPVGSSSNGYFTGYGLFKHDSNITDGEETPVYAAHKDFNDTFTFPVKYDYSTLSDMDVDSTGSLVAISSSFETQDFSISLEDSHIWARAYFELQGMGSTDDAIVASISTDAGVTYDGAHTFSVTNAQPNVYTAHFNRQAYRARYKVACATSGDGFKCTAFEIRPGQMEQSEA